MEFFACVFVSYINSSDVGPIDTVCELYMTDSLLKLFWSEIQELALCSNWKQIILYLSNILLEWNKQV